MSERLKGHFLPLSVVISALYFSQGLPGGIIGHALPALLREQNVSLEMIGLIKLLALPWLLKFLWAPVVDLNPGYRGRSKWIISMQLLSCLFITAFAFMFSNDLASLGVVAIVLLLLINMSSATQDVATDGLAVSLVPERLRGLANSIQVVGYKVGMLAGGSGLLILAGHFSTSSLMQGIAVLLCLLLLPLIYFGKHLGPLVPKTENVDPNATAVPWKAYLGFFKTPNIGLWLAVLLSYKMADSLGSGMLKPMLIDIGYGLEDVGYITLVASICGMGGAILGGLVFKLLGPGRSLLIFGVLQAVFVSAFYFIAPGTLSAFMVGALVIAEQIADGASTVALFALMMWHCRDEHEGADYTIQMSAQILLAGLLGALSGLIASQLSYAGLYLICAGLSIVTLVLVLKYIKQDQSHFNLKPSS